MRTLGTRERCIALLLTAAALAACAGDAGEALVPGTPAVPFAEFACQAGDEIVDSETDSEATEQPLAQIDEEDVLGAVRQSFEWDRFGPQAPVRAAELVVHTADAPPFIGAAVTAAWSSEDPDVVGAYFYLTHYEHGWDVDAYVACRRFVFDVDSS